MILDNDFRISYFITEIKISKPKFPFNLFIFLFKQVKTDFVLRMVDHYKNKLSVYGHETLPRFTSPKPFHNRIDSLMLLIARQCFNLHTLVSFEHLHIALYSTL